MMQSMHCIDGLWSWGPRVSVRFGPVERSIDRRTSWEPPIDPSGPHTSPSTHQDHIPVHAGTHGLVMFGLGARAGVTRIDVGPVERSIDPPGPIGPRPMPFPRPARQPMCRAHTHKYMYYAPTHRLMCPRTHLDDPLHRARSLAWPWPPVLVCLSGGS